MPNLFCRICSWHSLPVSLFLCLVMRLGAQAPGDSMAAHHLATGAELVQADRLTEGKAYLFQALSYFEKDSIVYAHELAQTLQHLSFAYYAGNNYDSSTYFLTYGTRIADRYLPASWELKAKLANRLAWIHLDHFEFEEAKTAFLRKLSFHLQDPHPDFQQISKTYHLAGTMMFHLRQMDSARFQFHAALEVIKTHDFKVTKGLEGKLHLYLGHISASYTDPRQALIHLHQALSLWTQDYGPKDKRVAKVLTDLSTIYRWEQDYEQALAYLQRAQRIFEHTPSLANNYHDQVNYADLLTQVGLIFQETGQYQQAIDHFHQALGLEGGLDPRQSMNLLAFISNTYRMDGQLAQAIKFAHQAVNRDLHYLEALPDRAYAFRTLAKAYVAAGAQRDPEALAALDQAIQLLQLGDEHSPPKVASQSLMVEVLYTKAQLFQRQADTEPQVRFQAYAYYQEALGYVKRIYKGHRRDASLRWLQAHHYELYDKAIQCAYQLAEQTGSSTYVADMLTWMEENRAVTLRKSLQKHQALQFVDVPTEIRVEEERLATAIQEVEQQMIQASLAQQSRSELTEIRQKWIKAYEAYDVFQAQLAKDHPAYYEIAYQSAVPSLHEVQQQLAPNEGILAFFAGQSALYRLFMLPDTVLYTRIPLDHHLQKDLSTYRSFHRSSDISSETFTALSQRLGQVLLPSNLQGVSHLTVVPDGPLGHIPFETLIHSHQAGRKSDFRRASYLIAQASISYVYSLGAWYQPQSKGTIPNKTPTFAGFAPNYPQQEPLAFEATRISFEPVSLPGAQAEVALAAGMFSSSLYLNQAATEHAFKTLPEEPTILHLAMHAYTDDQHPLVSRFLFASQADSLEDGYLHAYEIYGMQLHSQLAVLSACETAYGKFQRGEGIMSLAHAFAYAGVPSLVTSLWRAEDQATQLIMRQFYTHLKEGKPKDEALRQAKLIFLQNADKVSAHPYFWANFILIGEASPIQPPHSPTHTPWIALGIILLALLGIWAWKKR